MIDWSIIYSCDFGQLIRVQWERHCSCGKVLIKGSIWALFFERGLLKCFNSERKKKKKTLEPIVKKFENAAVGDK